MYLHRYAKNVVSVLGLLSALVIATPAAQADQPWSVSFDNDFLVPIARDQDYTYGVSFTQHQSPLENTAVAPSKALNAIESLIGLEGEQGNTTLELGLYGLTPEKSDDGVISEGDRPFASLVYFSSSRILHSPNPRVKWRSSLTVGALGLPVVGSLQNSFHSLISNAKVKGWDDQISDGGEPTARYSLAHQSLVIDGKRFELKRTINASAGYLTEASLSFSLRYGKIQSHWASNTPELSFYREGGLNGDISRRPGESYALFGAAVKQRFYNAFVQGQFRHSELSYDYEDLNHTLVEVWAGYVHSFKQHYQLTYNVRAHSSELKRGAGNRTVIWGGLNIARLI